MYRIVGAPATNLADVESFIEQLNSLADINPELRPFFTPDGDLFVTRAPGRLDLMGGIADYSGSLVLQMPIAEATLVALQKTDEPKIRIASLTDGSRTLQFEMTLADYFSAGRVVDYVTARKFFEKDPTAHWAAYAAGAFIVLMRELGVEFREGARILISSGVPQGKGVSSSAAFEVAVMQAIAAAFGITISPRDLALLCQKVENLVVGAACGVMDQMTASCGEENRLLSLLCQPAELRDPVSIPSEIVVWGLDSGRRHSVSGADYTSVRVGAFMGYRMIAALADLPVRNVADQLVAIADPKWCGYLANLSPAEFEHSYEKHLPDRIAGADFLSRYGGTTDAVTRVDPKRIYNVRLPTRHPVYEHHRVKRFSELMGCANGEHQLELLGNLMYESHASYSACGLGSAETDLLVQLVRSAGPDQGLYGAKITGGGCGGTVAVLGRRSAGHVAIRKVVDEFRRITGYTPHVFSGSSPGSAKFGYLRLRRHAGDFPAGA